MSKLPKNLQEEAIVIFRKYFTLDNLLRELTKHRAGTLPYNDGVDRLDRLIFWLEFGQEVNQKEKNALFALNEEAAKRAKAEFLDKHRGDNIPPDADFSFFHPVMAISNPEISKEAMKLLDRRTASPEYQDLLRRMGMITDL